MSIENGRLLKHDISLYEPMISRMNWAISIGMLNHDIMNEVGSNFANLGPMGG